MQRLPRSSSEACAADVQRVMSCRVCSKDIQNTAAACDMAEQVCALGFATGLGSSKEVSRGRGAAASRAVTTARSKELNSNVRLGQLCGKAISPCPS